MEKGDSQISMSPEKTAGRGCGRSGGSRPEQVEEHLFPPSGLWAAGPCLLSWVPFPYL